MDEAGSEGGQSELAVDDPKVVELMRFLDEFDERIESHRRALTAHNPGALSNTAVNRRMNDLQKTVVGMRQAVTQLRADIRAGKVFQMGSVDEPSICDRLTDILKIGV